MKKTVYLFIFSFVIAFCSDQPITDPENFLSDLEILVKNEMEGKKMPGIAIGIVKDQKIIFEKTFGFLDVENRIPTETTTVYQIGSVTKMFTGHVLASLIDEDKISLSDDLADYFPDSLGLPVSSNSQAVTIRDIATHSAEFPRYPENLQRVDPDPILGFSVEELYNGIELVKIHTTIGERYQYSNFGYGVLGTALENLTGRSLNELMATYIFEPAEMRSSSLSLNNDIREYLAVPYLEVSPLKRTEPWDMGALSGAGNLFSTITDLNRFMMFLLEENSVNRIQQAKYLSINESWSYGLGCFIVDSQKRETFAIYHGGDIDGYSSSLTLYPEYGFGMVLLTNYGEGQVVGEVFSKIEEFILNNTIDVAVSEQE